MTDEQMLAQAKVLNALFGGEVKLAILRIFCIIRYRISLGVMIWVYMVLRHGGLYTKKQKGKKKDISHKRTYGCGYHFSYRYNSYDNGRY